MATVGLPPTTHAEQTDITAQVSVDNISKVIVNKTTKTVILDALSFSIAKGSLFAINGPSGSGKSTLLNIVDRH